MRESARRILMLLVLGAAFASSLPAQEISYLEDFALARDRSIPLEQLIPGTEEYFYFHSLHYLNTQQFDRLTDLLADWIDRHGVTARVQQVQHRRALLTYSRQPRQSLDYLRDQLELRFDHQRRSPDARPDLPTRLDPQLISVERLREQAWQRHEQLEGFELSANQWLVTASLEPELRRQLLGRLRRPDYPGLAELIVADLEYRNSGRFGSMPIHGLLLLDQLEACAEQMPGLLSNTNFVNTYLLRLRPGDDVAWEHDDEAHREYLDRLEAFTRRLPPVHNSLKAHVLYHRLVWDRQQSVYDRDRFLDYLALPRPQSYMRPEYIQLVENRRFQVDLAAAFPTTFSPIAADEELVRSYLEHFFVEADDFAGPFDEYLRQEYLQRVFAETKLVNGLGDAERWYSLLTPAEVQQIQQRVDLDFAYTNESVFAADQPVRLDLFVKGVDTLIVKVFEINTFNYYRRHASHVSTGVNLDGLVPNHQATHEYSEPDLRRVRRQFEFPELDERGVYVIDFIGEGQSSRVVVRKGRLRYLSRTTSAGVEFTVLDEQSRHLEEAHLWMGGREYAPADDGKILVPYSNQPGPQPIILTAGEFSWLEIFHHPSESYQLAAGIHVDREMLLAGRQAEVLIRPQLELNGLPISLSLLENVRLTITSVDQDGIVVRNEVEDLPLHADRETTYEFQVPPRLSQISFELAARVKNLSSDEHQELSSTASFSVNAIDSTEKTSAMLLSQVAGNWNIFVRGRNGEARADHVVQFALKHADFTDPVSVSLQTDTRGRIRLGSLSGIETVTATGPEGTTRTWQLVGDRHTLRQAVHAREGEPIEVPYLGDSEEPTREEFSLLELREGVFVVDRFDSLEIRDGMLVLRDLPRGNYDLWLKNEDVHVRVRVARGRNGHGFVLGEHRHLERRGNDPLHISAMDVEDDEVRVQLRHVSPFARVHLLATRYEPEFRIFDQLSIPRDAVPGLSVWPDVESMYVEGRNIGDEYRYIIERQYVRHFPGNMLERPSLLLNPWALRSTETERQDAQAGTDFDSAAPDAEASAAPTAARDSQDTSASSFPNLDFLGQTSIVVSNVVPEEDGTLVIPRDVLGHHRELFVVAVDPDDCVVRRLSLTSRDLELVDLRQRPDLDPERHYTQQKQISVVPAGQPLLIGDVRTSRFEVYRDLQSVFELMVTVSKNPTLQQFEFVTRWPSLSDEEKRDKYSEFACHELNFFIYQRDPEFFREIVAPHLENKLEYTFMDHWHLELPLDRFREPWNYERLNTAERILLGRRLDAEQPYTAMFIGNAVDVNPPQVQDMDFLFDSAILTDSLEFEGEVRLLREQALAEQESLMARGELGENWAFGGVQGRSGGGGEAAAAGTPRPSVLLGVESAESNADRPDYDRWSRRDREAPEAGMYFYDLPAERRVAVQQLYRPVAQTKEWVENHYYHLPLEQQTSELITPNTFWRDYAEYDGEAPFFSQHFATATRSFPEMMFALAILDLPFEAGELESTVDESGMTLTCATPMVVFHEQIEPADAVADSSPILVSQNLYPHGRRYREEDGQQVDNYVRDEFVVHQVYTCQVVVTNPASVSRTLDVLLQVPAGAIPVLGSRYTRSVSLALEPFHTQALEYHFYFPQSGEFPHYPVHVSQNEEVLAFADAESLPVVETPSQFDPRSWVHVSQNGTEEEVLAFLESRNLQQVDLGSIAFRMRDREFFVAATDVLARRHHYDHTLWSYSIHHDVPDRIQEFLKHADVFVQQTGEYLDSPLLVIDPFERGFYQHRDYRPLVNARAHQLGERRQIVNEALHHQYHSLLRILSYRRELEDRDLIEVTLYMLMQDRVEEAIGFLQRVDPDNLRTRIQFDYLSAYVNFYLEQPEQARALVEKYEDHPVERWREVFLEVGAQLNQIQSGLVRLTDEDDGEEELAEDAVEAPSLTVSVEGQTVRIDFQNMETAEVNYYEMDIELLFSRNPFVQQFAAQFSSIRPNMTERVELPAGGNSLEFPLPERFHNRNILVEVRGAGQVSTQAYYANDLAVQVIESYGQVRVRHQETGESMPRVYVKVYALLSDGRVEFYKDGYTDLRGRFDYASLSTNQLDSVAKFAILVMSEEQGSLVREAQPPLQ